MQKLAKNNTRSIILFIVTYPSAKSFAPNSEADMEFAKLIRSASYYKSFEVHAIKICLYNNGNVELIDPDLPVDLEI